MKPLLACQATSCSVSRIYAPLSVLTFDSRLSNINGMIKLPKHRSLATRVTERLFEAVLQGDLKPGQRIIETKMAKQLGVGQSTFREALQTLEHRGLVTKNRRTFITKNTIQDIEVLFAVRLELEPLAASLACGRLGSTHLREIEFHLEEMKKATEQWDFSTRAKNDLAFHQVIWEAPQINALSRIMDLVMPPLFAYALIVHSDLLSREPSRAEEAFKEDDEHHCKLLAVLRARNPEHVKKTFREIIQRFLEKIKADPAPQGSSRSPQPGGQMYLKSGESLNSDRPSQPHTRIVRKPPHQRRS